MLLALGLPAVAKAQEFAVADIIVDGYQRISPGIIYNLLPIGIGDVVTERTAAEVIRSLVTSEYFDEIEVAREGNILVITVLERPSVAEITVEGNGVLETEDIIENISIKTRQYAKRQSTWARGNMNTWLKLKPNELNNFLKKI